MAVHRSAHVDLIVGFFVEKDVPVERTKDDPKAPIVEPRMGEPALGSKQRVLSEQPASGFHRLEVIDRPRPTRR